uniref:Uncharacterized protein n=1 Tax=Phlebotomus papatasi TaxID=29031 RepID=A0A1B0D862_PHLPP
MGRRKQAGTPAGGAEEDAGEMARLREENERLKAELNRLRERNEQTCDWKMTGAEAKEEIPKFRPGESNMNPSKWVADVEVMKNTYQWESRQTRLYAASRLRGAAVKWYGKIGYESRHLELLEWDDFRREFLDAFPDVNDFSEIHNKLLKRKRKATEDLEDYIYDVQHMGKMVDMNDEQIRKYILSGLDDQELRGMVSMSHRCSVPELLRQLKAAESVLRDVRCRKDYGSHSRASSSKRRRVECTGSHQSNRSNKSDRDERSSGGSPGRSSSLERGTTSSRKQSGQNPHVKKGPICYSCNKPGHLARNCPDKMEVKPEGKNGVQVRVLEKVMTKKNEFEKTIKIRGQSLAAFVDLGADCSAIRERCARRLDLNTEPCEVKLRGFANGECQVQRKARETIQLDGIEEIAVLHIVPDQETLKKKDLVPKVARWFLKIQEYDFDMEFRPGTQLTHADALSRQPTQPAKEFQTVSHKIFRVETRLEDWVSTLQMQDEELRDVRRVLDGELLNHSNLEAIKRDYHFSDGRLYRNTESGYKFVVPHGLRYHPSIEELRDEAVRRINKSRLEVVKKHNETHRPPSRYEEGDLVLLKAEHPATGSSRKLLPRFRGPYVISKVLGADRYEVKDTESTQITRKPYCSVHSTERMKKWPNLEDLTWEELDEDDADSTEN